MFIIPVLVHNISLLIFNSPNVRNTKEIYETRQQQTNDKLNHLMHVRKTRAVQTRFKKPTFFRFKKN